MMCSLAVILLGFLFLVNPSPSITGATSASYTLVNPESATIVTLMIAALLLGFLIVKRKK